MYSKPQLRVNYGEPVGNELFCRFPDISNNEITFFEADLASGQTSITANGTNFSIGQYVVLGQPGSEKTEIIKIHASTAPNATTITLASATNFDHNRGDVITFIPYNQIIVERSTDAGLNYTPLSAVDIRPDALETQILRSSDTSTDYYRYRFYNSADATYSAYSDAVIGTGYDDNTIWSIKYRALESMGEKIGEGLINDTFLNNSLQEARRDVDQDKRVFRWSFRTSFNTDIGNVIPGTYRLAVPSDLRDPNTNKNILSLKIGSSAYPLEYQDKNRFNENYYNVAHTTLGATLSDSDVTVTLTSSGDFTESGNISIAAESVSGTIDTVAYTANNESTNVLSGVTGIATGGSSSGTDVWQNATFGTPTYYTIFDGYIYFDVPFSDDLAGENIWMDYYKTIPSKINDSDELDEPEYDFYVAYLRYKIKYLKSGGETKQDDPDFITYKLGVDALVSKDITGQEIHFVPDIDNYTRLL